MSSIVEVSKVMEVIESGVRTFINKHNGQRETLEGYVVVHANIPGETTTTKFVCPVFDTIFSLNPLFIREDADDLFLSKRSVAGTLDNRGKDLALAVEEYNDTIRGRNRLLKWEEDRGIILEYKKF